MMNQLQSQDVEIKPSLALGLSLINVATVHQQLKLSLYKTLCACGHPIVSSIASMTLPHPIRWFQHLIIVIAATQHVYIVNLWAVITHNHMGMERTKIAVTVSMTKHMIACVWDRLINTVHELILSSAWMAMQYKWIHQSLWITPIRMTVWLPASKPRMSIRTDLRIQVQLQVALIIKDLTQDKNEWEWC